MSAKILDGKVLSEIVKSNIKQEIEKLSIKPCLAVVMVGNDPASEIYVRNKQKACEAVGIKSKTIKLDSITKEQLIKEIDKLNKDKNVHGILLQLPLPKDLPEQEILQCIDSKKDVDGFHPINMGKLVIGLDAFVPCTPAGILRMMDLSHISLEGLHAVVVGRSNIVGKPISQLLLQRNATVTTCHSHTRNLKEIIRQADVLIAAVGKPHFITADMIKPGAVVVDVGINRLGNGKIVGDVDFDNAKEIAGYITPVPGGVGPMTVAMLMENVLKASCKK